MHSGQTGGAGGDSRQASSTEINNAVINKQVPCILCCSTGFDAAECLAALGDGDHMPVSEEPNDILNLAMADVPRDPPTEPEAPEAVQDNTTLKGGPMSIQDLMEAGPSGVSGPVASNPRGRPRKRPPGTATPSQFTFLGPKCLKNQEAYRIYYEQEADHFARALTEPGTVPMIPPTGSDITNQKLWEGSPMSDQERLAYAWGAAQAVNPYGIATIINQGGSLATAISHALQTVEPTRGIESCYIKPPIWPVAGNERVLLGQTTKTMPTTKNLKKDMDQAEKVTFQGIHGLQATELYLAQSTKIRIRTYLKKTNEKALTHAGASGEGGRKE